MKESLLQKLQNLAERREELDGMLGAPEIISDQTRFRGPAREHAEISPLVESFSRYKETLAVISGAQELMREDDAEMRALAEDELKATNEAKQEARKKKARSASAKYREKKRKGSASNPVEKERVRANKAYQRNRRRKRNLDPEAHEKQRMWARESYLRGKARLDADPVEKERVRIADVARHRERRARINADPEARRKLLEKAELVRKRYRDTKRARSEEAAANQIE